MSHAYRCKECLLVWTSPYAEGQAVVVDVDGVDHDATYLAPTCQECGHGTQYIGAIQQERTV